MSETWFIAITDLGDSAVLLPLAVVAAAVLCLLAWRRAAAVLAAGVLASGAVVCAMKLLLRDCAAALHSPSGHTALSVVVYGLLAGILGRHLGRRRAILLGLAAALLVAAIAVSRVVLEAHSWQEVAAGGLTGAAILAACLRRLGPAPAIKVQRLVAACLLPIILMHGHRMPSEAVLAQMAGLFPQRATICTAGGSRSETVPSW